MSDPFTVEFGQRLRAARVASSLSQTDLGALTGIPKPTLSRYENGHVLPSITTLVRFLDVLDLDATAFFEDLPGRSRPARDRRRSRRGA